MPADTVADCRIEPCQAAVHLAVDGVMKQEGGKIVIIQTAVRRVVREQGLIRGCVGAVGLVKHLQAERLNG
jgi:hypothetical protein